MKVRSRVGLKAHQVRHRCVECKERYLAHRVFRDPDDRKIRCIPSCNRNAEDVRILSSLPDFEVADWVRPSNFEGNHGGRV